MLAEESTNWLTNQPKKKAQLIEQDWFLSRSVKQSGSDNHFGSHSPLSSWKHTEDFCDEFFFFFLYYKTK